MADPSHQDRFDKIRGFFTVTGYALTSCRRLPSARREAERRQASTSDLDIPGVVNRLCSKLPWLPGGSCRSGSPCPGAMSIKPRLFIPSAGRPRIPSLTTTGAPQLSNLAVSRLWNSTWTIPSPTKRSLLSHVRQMRFPDVAPVVGVRLSRRGSSLWVATGSRFRSPRRSQDGSLWPLRPPGGFRPSPGPLGLTTVGVGSRHGRRF